MPRDGVGNFTLAPGNPVVPGTVIEAAWANPTLSDIAGALTDSLSRSGAGGMLVPFRNIDGTVGAPGMTWVNEPSSGWYRAALNDFWYSVGNENIFRITKTTVELAPGKTLLLNGSTISGGVISGTSLNIASGILVASAPALNVTQTWNNAAVVFVGKDTNITDTASDPLSLIERWRVGGVEIASIKKTGIYATTAISGGTTNVSASNTSNTAGSEARFLAQLAGVAAGNASFATYDGVNYCQYGSLAGSNTLYWKFGFGLLNIVPAMTLTNATLTLPNGSLKGGASAVNFKIEHAATNSHILIGDSGAAAPFIRLFGSTSATPTLIDGRASTYAFNDLAANPVLQVLTGGGAAVRGVTITGSSSSPVIGTTAGSLAILTNILTRLDTAGIVNFQILNGSAAGPSMGIHVNYFGGAPNDVSHYPFFFDDSVTFRFYVKSNGGVANYTANDSNLSDATMKSDVARVTPDQMAQLWAAHKAIDWSHYKFADQTHDDPNFGYTAQGIKAAFATAAPWLIDDFLVADGVSKLGVFHDDLHNITGAIVSELQRRVEALEAAP